ERWPAGIAEASPGPTCFTPVLLLQIGAAGHELVELTAADEGAVRLEGTHFSCVFTVFVIPAERRPGTGLAEAHNAGLYGDHRIAGRIVDARLWIGTGLWLAAQQHSRPVFRLAHILDR